MTDGPRTWYLALSSFMDYSPRASHWYGEIGRDDGWRQDAELPHQLVRVLNADDAKALTETDDFTWHAGDDTERFTTRDAVIAAADRYFQEVSGPGDHLFLGRDLGQPGRTLLTVNNAPALPAPDRAQTPEQDDHELPR